ncbi:MAG: 23S rRNA (guanosine(2251)-2'-O)-methyltransferase RlmB [Anaerolineae bacterium]|nr:23S rRNA (guanosine(2251)-2'-O)-methyltransferase RlmB [Anaerolineae bacterium]MDW8100634.1 23S rRNA (guanosine(2251)-2'-O)-methyltransferase RlmB [Anaerolineae bacterium]
MNEILYGRHAVLEALRAKRRRALRLFLAEGVQERGTVLEILEIAHQRGIPVQRVRRGELDRLGTTDHQGVAMEATPFPYVELEDILTAAAARSELPFLLLLDHLQDPQNLGTLLRTAEAVGVHGVVLPERRAAGVTPAVSNVSAGAVEHLHVARVTNLVQTIEKLKRAGVWVIGLERTASAIPYDRADLSGPLALVVGSEGGGMSRLVREHCDWLVMLPMFGRINSLNAAVAGSIVLYTAVHARQREVTCKTSMPSTPLA